MELKYCEHCGGLWCRKRGAAAVYCDHCQVKVAELPVPKKEPERIILPVRQHTAVEDYEFEIGEEKDLDFEASMGGAA